MSGIDRCLAVAGGALSLTLAGCVSSAPAAKPTAVKDWPRLEVRVDCGDCEIKADLPGLILEGNVAAVARTGARDATSSTATLTIRTYSQRRVGTRFLVGPLGAFFRNAMQAELVFDGRNMQVYESARAPFQGMDAVVRRIGEKALESLQQ